jgi:hypothetical protein
LDRSHLPPAFLTSLDHPPNVLLPPSPQLVIAISSTTRSVVEFTWENEVVLQTHDTFYEVEAHCRECFTKMSPLRIDLKLDSDVWSETLMAFSMICMSFSLVDMFLFQRLTMSAAIERKLPLLVLSCRANRVDFFLL